MASLCPQWRRGEPLPPTMAPFNLPQEGCPKSTACVGRALHTKGGVSRFSAHFTSIHREGNKSSRPVRGAGQRGPAPTSPPRYPHPRKPQPFSGAQGKATLSQDHRADVALPSPQDICMKMRCFCPPRRAKGSLRAKGAEEASRKTLNYASKLLLKR